jgi:tetratricopeptide (TPR) repeat protein
MDYTVVGQTAHLAARMEQMAKPGSVLTTADTLQLAEDYVTMKPLGPVPVKGLTDPIPIYEVTGAGAARTRLQAAAGRGLTRFVGRDLELEQLRRAQELTGQGHGQVVAIVGEAGVGKSRLVRELAHSDHTASWLVLESNSTSYGRATPYLPIIELLRHYFKIRVHDDTRSIRDKVTGKISALDSSLEDAIPPVLDLLDALDQEHPFRSLDLAQRRHHTYQAIVRLVLGETRSQPVVAVFEDLQWSDSLTLGLLNELVVSAQNARLLLVVTYRLEYKDEWRSRPNYCQLRLDPLASETLAEFLQALLGPDPSLIFLKSFLADRASGNPFFAEEIVRALAGTRVLERAHGGYRLARPFSSTEVPPTVQAVLAARIDALPPAEKRLLHEAAVIGHEAPFALLHAICGLAESELRGLLDNLQAAEFLYATQLFPDLQYTFKHSLTHDVTYRGVLHERRRDIHARVVEAIEKLYTDRLGEQVERLAYHSLRAELKEKAVHYLRQAGAKDTARGALQEARTSFEQALDILKSVPESRTTMEEAFEVRLELRTVLRQLGEVGLMLKHLREAEVLAEQLNDDVRRCRVLSFLTIVLSNLGQVDEAAVIGARSVEIARHIGDLRLGIITGSTLAEPYYLRGKYEQAVEVAAGSLAALPSQWAHEYFGMAVPPSVFARGWLVMSLADLGRFQEAIQYEAEAIRIAEATKHTHTIGWAQLTASKLHLLKGDWAKARDLLEDWINMPGTLDVAILLPWAVTSLAWTLAQIGDASEALSRLREGEEHLKRQEAEGIFVHRGWSYHAVARGCLLLGRLDEARRLADRSIESSQRQPNFVAHARCILGDLAIHPEYFDAESAATHYRAALTLAKPRGMRPLAAHCHFGLGRLHRRTGNPGRARQHLTAAKNMYSEMDMGFWLTQVEAE